MSKDSSEIDREVAKKVMGWTSGRDPNFNDALVWNTGERVRYAESWSPSTRIDHVWEAVGKLDLWSMEWHKNGDPGEPLWYDVTIWPDPENPSGGVGGTLCEAICNALLAAVKDQPQ